jgi:hypothetical protein
LTTSDPALFATAAGNRVCRIAERASYERATEYPDEETVDPDWPVWVGVIPAKLVFGAPLPDPVRNRVAIAPEHVAGFRSKDDLRPACDAPPLAGVRT